METQSHNGRQRENAPAQAGQTRTPQDTPASRGGSSVQPGEQALTPERSRQSSPRRAGRSDLSSDLSAGPVGTMLQLSREMDRLWDSFFGRSFGSPSRLFGGLPFETGQAGFGGREGAAPTLWSPRIDVQQREDAVHIHADLPGCRKEDVRIEATEEGIALSGERSQQREEGESGKGYHFSERSYGSFYRNIPLPEGAKVEQAKARMAEGVLQVTIPLQQPERRRIQIE